MTAAYSPSKREYWIYPLFFFLRSLHYQITLCLWPAMRRKTLPFVVHRFFCMVSGSNFQVGFLQPPTLPDMCPLHTPSVRELDRKNSPSFGRFTPTLGGEIFLSLFFVDCGTVFEVGFPCFMVSKRLELLSAFAEKCLFQFTHLIRHCQALFYPYKYILCPVKFTARLGASGRRGP